MINEIMSNHIDQSQKQIEWLKTVAGILDSRPLFTELIEINSNASESAVVEFKTQSKD